MQDAQPSPTAFRRVGRDITKLSRESLGCGCGTSSTTTQILGRRSPQRSFPAWVDSGTSQTKQNIPGSRLLKNSISVERSSSFTYYVNVGCLLKSIFNQVISFIPLAIHTRLLLHLAHISLLTLDRVYLPSGYVPLDILQTPQNTGATTLNLFSLPLICSSSYNFACQLHC